MAKLENLKEDLHQRAIDNRLSQVANEEAISRLNMVVNDTVSTIKNEFKDYDTRQRQWKNLLTSKVIQKWKLVY